MHDNVRTAYAKLLIAPEQRPGEDDFNHKFSTDDYVGYCFRLPTVHLKMYTLLN